MLEDIGFFLISNGSIINVAFGVIKIVTGFRVYPPYSSDHFRGEENVLVIDYVEQHIDTFLVVHTGIKINVVH